MRDTILQSSLPITLEGRDYTLRYRAFAFVSYAERTNGGDLLQDIRELGLMLSPSENGSNESGGNAEGATAIRFNSGKIFKTLVDVLWAGLVDAHPEVKPEQVARLFGFADFQRITEAVMGALRLTMPDQATPRPTIPTPITNPSGGGLVNGRDYGQVSETRAESPHPNSWLSHSQKSNT